jgi:diguanylate cyclase (GGDEF)-like protein
LTGSGDEQTVDLEQFHWLLEILHSIDVGLVVLDRNYRVRLWNAFMENHSGLRPAQVRDRNLFELFPDIPEAWFRSKAESVFLLDNRAFTIWEQRPHLFHFKSYRPVTGVAGQMFQNTTFMPLAALDGSVEYLCLIVYDVTDFAVTKQALEAANRTLTEESLTDPLTGLYNRRAWDARLEEEFSRYLRTSQPTSLVLLDIDHFKTINDTYGHPVGDEVIRALAGAIRETARATDIAGRYGGEEFSVILIGARGEAAVAFAERLRLRVRNLAVAVAEEALRFTVSLGIASVDETTESPAVWLEQADRALYAAKEAGRNTCRLFGSG